LKTSTRIIHYRLKERMEGKIQKSHFEGIILGFPKNLSDKKKLGTFRLKSAPKVNSGI